MKMSRLLIGVLVAGLTACAGVPPQEAQRYEATITRTKFGIAHVKAADYGGLGYGAAYSRAQDNICLLAETYVTLSGERAKFFGAAGDALIGLGAGKNLDSDFYHRAVLDVPISVDADVARATELLRRIGDDIADDAEWAPLILDAPSVMGIQKIDVDSLQLRFVARTLPGKQWEVGRELRTRIARAFYQAGISASMPVMSEVAAK